MLLEKLSPSSIYLSDDKKYYTISDLNLISVDLSGIVLLEQNFVKDSSITIKDLITSKVAVLGENILINHFSRFQIGDK